MIDLLSKAQKKIVIYVQTMIMFCPQVKLIHVIVLVSFLLIDKLSSRSD